MENQKRKAESEGRWCVAKAAGKFLWENQGAGGGRGRRTNF